MAEDILTGAAQENLIALLAHSPQHGRIIAGMLDPGLFDGDYRLLAERMLAYWHEHNAPPRQHVPDLMADILEDRSNKKAPTFRRIIQQMQELAESEPNAQYVISTLQQFSRMQRLKDALYRGAEILSKPGPATIVQVEEILSGIMKARDFQFDPGARLDDLDRFIQAFNRRGNEFVTGIQALDERYIVPARGEVITLLAPSGYGKTWFLVNVGKHALMNRKRVLHVSLEVSEELVMQRYYQSLFAVAKRIAEVSVSRLKLNRNGDFVGISTDSVMPSFSFASAELRLELESRLMKFGRRLFENLRIKRFPTRALTVDGLEAYLDGMETTQGFTPDMLILDYPGIMKTDERNHRISLGRVFENIRGMLVARSVAGAVVHQTSKIAMEARRTKTSHAGEDFSIIQTSDIACTYSATMAERQRGLARIYVDKARNERDGWGVLLTQAYDIGQFALESMYLPNQYYDFLERLGKRASKADGEAGEDDSDQAEDEEAQDDEGDE